MSSCYYSHHNLPSGRYSLFFPGKNISRHLACNCYMSVFPATVACRVKSLNRCRIEQALLKGTEEKRMIIKKLIKKNINGLFLSVYKCKCYYLKFRIIVKHCFTFKGLFHLSTNVIVQVDIIIKATGTTVVHQTKCI